MKCAKCGYQNPDEVEECQQCGINLVWATENITEPCPACNTPNSVLAEKCSNCGLNLEWEREQRKKKEEEEKRQQELELAAQERTVQAQTQAAAAKEEGRKMARNALIAAIVGIFICGIAFEPYAIYRAGKAKEILFQGERGYGNATAAQIIGWIALVLWVIGLIATIANA